MKKVLFAVLTLQKAGIPVVLLARNIKVSDPTLYTTFIGSDFILEGKRVAQ